MGARDRILARIVDAESPLPSLRPITSFEPADLWTQFLARFEELGGQELDANRLRLLLGLSTWIEPAAARLVDQESSAAEIWDAEVGVSVAVVAVAETGSLVVTSHPGAHRLSSLIPPVNVILIKPESIVGTLTEALSCTEGRNAVIITGPSRTADIEGILVKGVHGPRELYIYRGDFNGG